MKHVFLISSLFFFIRAPGTSSFIIPSLHGGAVTPTKTTLVSNGAATESTSSDASSETYDGASATNLKIKKILAELQKVLLSVRSSYPFVPLAFTFGLGYRVGRQALKSTAESPAAAASKPVAAANRFPVLSAVLFAVAVREGWRIIPSWIKRRIPIVGKKMKGKDVIDQANPDDLTSVSAIWRRMKSLLNLLEERLASSLDAAELQAAFFAAVQLTAQVKQQQAEYRDARYCQSGELIENPKEIMEGLDEAFEFADWAYDELPDEKTLREAFQEIDFDLLRHDKVVLPGVVAHYVAISKSRKLAVIGVKGTSNFEDMITDCCGQTVPFELEEPFVAGGTKNIRCHDGILLASRRLASDLQTLVEELLLPSGYRLLVTGHSLGAGVAALTSLFLRSRIPSLRNDDGKMNVLAFAPPPVLDYESSLACMPFTTSIVNNGDIIPRSSLANLRVLVEALKTLYEKLDQKGIAPKDAKSKRAFMAKLVEGKGGEMIMTTQEIGKAMDDAYNKVELNDPDHLYVPGRVIHLFDLWSKEGYGEKAAPKEAEEGGQMKRTAERAYVGDGASRPLRYFEMDSRMVSDHLAPDYRSSINALLGESSITRSKAPEDE